MRTRRHPRFDERAADGSHKAEPAHGRRPYRRFADSPLHADIASQTQDPDLIRGVDAGRPSCLR
ncbi:hypothetical protein [Schaalia cardiffensis]|uniref:hypothetical protein n=1 Tax=Schaalia cardiffensis TaxID=181487 RepID=UPI0023EFE06A|nr:hypothetical protein [Schaalia cardiffensis]